MEDNMMEQNLSNNYVICMDASGDIIREVAEENGIAFVPMEYSLDRKSVV